MPIILFAIVCVSLNVRLVRFVNSRQPLAESIYILGDSNTECALFSFEDYGLLNRSHSGDSYFYCYLELKKLLHSGTDISQVYVGFSPHNIFTSIDKRWLLNPENMAERFPYYLPFMSDADGVFILGKAGVAVLRSIPALVRQSFKNLVFYHGKSEWPHLWRGGYRRLDESSVDQAVKLSNEVTQASAKSTLAYSAIEKFYLRKIIKLCRENSLVVNLICTPKRAEGWDPNSTIIKSFYTFYSNEFSDVEFIDSSTFPLSKDKFKDLMHLNYTGAEEYSQYFLNTHIVPN